eukprot:CAMPEP_0113844598 /NCGR_PEP_ID=MMETSP0372-20130328/318_1 /TAXON_ID=340204 /ORGANISM="Lankesteria abbotti" /LENGTH=342 /DNA_ID=CAMNT_0000813603 /DNA_START=105 /DNA_END=1133 /DNA_ORIENTATION=+ /assembly_acc=CAM_ASM_000359
MALSASFLHRRSRAADKSRRQIANFTPTSSALRSGGGMRLVFGDTAPLDMLDDEVTALSTMRVYLKDNMCNVDGTPFEQDSYLLRFLQGCGWDQAETLADIRRHIDWRHSNLPLDIGTVFDNLPRGILYVHGRDRLRRPILIIRGSELALVEKDDVLKVVIYWLEWVVSSLMVPNKVEQWKVLVDLTNVGITTAPVLTLRDVAMVLHRNYRGRLAKLVFLNCPMVFVGLWQTVSPILPEATKQKILSLGADFKGELLKGISPNQLERKYGGEQIDVVDYTFPVMPEPPFDDDCHGGEEDEEISGGVWKVTAQNVITDNQRLPSVKEFAAADDILDCNGTRPT